MDWSSRNQFPPPIAYARSFLEHDCQVTQNTITGDHAGRMKLGRSTFGARTLGSADRTMNQCVSIAVGKGDTDE